MKTKKFIGIFTGMIISGAMLASCGAGDTINVISREDGSGTRGAFIELTGVEEKDEQGRKTDNTTEEAMILKSTDVVLTQVAGDENAIGYVSLGSLNDSVKAVKINGVLPKIETVESGEYTIVRPFNILENGTLSEAAQDLHNFIMSKEGQKIIEDAGYIAVNNSADTFRSNGASGKVIVGGSTSVGPVMEKLAEAFQKVNNGAVVEVQTSDSSTGVKDAINKTVDIGMASRELKDTETAQGIQGITIAKDAIAVIVHKNNEVDELSLEQIKQIYTGDIISWADIRG